jgi:hypothetical protein
VSSYRYYIANATNTYGCSLIPSGSQFCCLNPKKGLTFWLACLYISLLCNLLQDAMHHRTMIFKTFESLTYVIIHYNEGTRAHTHISA